MSRKPAKPGSDDPSRKAKPAPPPAVAPPAAEEEPTPFCYPPGPDQPFCPICRAPGVERLQKWFCSRCGQLLQTCCD